MLRFPSGGHVSVGPQLRNRKWRCTQNYMLAVSTFCNEFVSEKNVLKIASKEIATFRSDGILPCTFILGI